MPKTLCSYCKRDDGSHTDGCKKGPCKRCAKRPKDDPCPYHGGTRKKRGAKPAPGGAKKPAKVRAATRPPKPEPAAVASNGKFAAHITGLKQAVAAGLLAQAELDGYKASLA